MFDNHVSPEGWGLMPQLQLFGTAVNTYSVFMSLALLSGGLFLLFFGSRRGSRMDRLAIVGGALIGGILGSKIPILISYWREIGANPGLLLVGKSIVGGLVGGLIGVVMVKRLLGIRLRLGNDIAPAAALAMGIGRIGCLAAGCCYGKPTGMAGYGIRFGDGVLRHPTQLYEMVFDFGMFLLLLALRRWGRPKDGALFLLLINGYLVFRFFNEFFRADSPRWWGISSYQVICLGCLAFVNLRQLIRNKREEKSHEQPAAQ